MNTYIPKKSDLKEKWYVVDAKDKVLGRIAPTIANKLRGKDKPIFTPNIDCGAYVIVINADKVRLTSGKLEKKMYYTHSGYMGNLKTEKAKDLLARKPTELLKLAVYGMLPKNKLRKKFMGKLKLFAGETHNLSAQKPEKLEIRDKHNN